MGDEAIPGEARLFQGDVLSCRCFKSGLTPFDRLRAGRDAEGAGKNGMDRDEWHKGDKNKVHRPTSDVLWKDRFWIADFELKAKG